MISKFGRFRSASRKAANPGKRDLDQTSLQRLFRSQQYDEIIRILEDESIDLQSLIDANSATNLSKDVAFEQFRGETVLHTILSFNPPLDILNLVINRMWVLGTAPEEAVNMFGQTPLHIAVYTNCNLEVVERLMGIDNRKQALQSDNMMRYPLHWACVGSNKKTIPKRKLRCRRAPANEIENAIAIVRLLIKVAPEAMLAKDINGTTPLEIAKATNAIDQIQKMLEDTGKRSKSFRSLTETEVTSRSESLSETDLDSSCPYPKNLDNIISWSDDDFDDLSSLGIDGPSQYRRSRHQHVMEQCQI